MTKSTEGAVKIPVKAVLPNPEQPRTTFDEGELRGLAQSIKANGLINPVVVERAGNRFILVDGERRLRAVQMLKLPTIEAVIREHSNHNGHERMTKALVANVQRSNMGPVDEGRAYAELKKELHTLQAVADRVGVDIMTVSVKTRLLEFPAPVQKLFNERKLAITSIIMARLGELKAEEQVRVCTTAASRGWSSSTFERMLAGRLKKRPGTVMRGHQKKAETYKGHFDALALVDGHASLPTEMKETARQTCRACDLYESASLVMCRNCPLPDFLRRTKARAEGDKK